MLKQTSDSVIRREIPLNISQRHSGRKPSRRLNQAGNRNLKNPRCLFWSSYGVHKQRRMVFCGVLVSLTRDIAKKPEHITNFYCQAFWKRRMPDPRRCAGPAGMVLVIQGYPISGAGSNPMTLSEFEIKYIARGQKEMTRGQITLLITVLHVPVVSPRHRHGVLLLVVARADSEQRYPLLDTDELPGIQNQSSPSTPLPAPRQVPASPGL